jgi:hypothetical protein
MYWTKTGKYQSLYDAYFAKLVPKRGKARTPHGELLRVMTEILYRFYNDGDDTWFSMVQMGACDELYRTPHDAPSDVKRFFMYIPEECAQYNRELMEFDARSDDDIDDDEFDPAVARFTEEGLESIMDSIVMYVHNKETM